MRALQYPILAFVPVVAAPTAAVYVSGQQTQPIFVQSFQYEEKAEPIVFSAPAETVTSDKWDRGQSQPQFSIKRTAAFTEYATDQSSLLQPERPSIDKWYVRTSEPRRDLRRQQSIYPAFVREGLVSAPTTAVYISGQSCDPIAVQWFQFPTEAKSPFPITGAPETITVDKWFRRTEEPLFRKKRLIQYGVNTAIAEERIYPDALQATPVTPTFKAHRRHLQGFGAVGDLVPRTETITLDKWRPLDNQPRQDLKRQQYIYPFFTVDSQLHVIPGAEVILLDKWGRNYPDLIFRTKRLPDYGQFAVDAKQLTLGERITPDKWHPQISQPRLDLKRQQRLYPSVFADSQLFNVPGAEVIRVDKWGRNYPDLIPRAKRLQHLYPGDAQRLLFVVVPMRIDWVTQTSQPQMRLKRFERLYPSLAYTRVILAASQEPAVWQNLATVTLNAADLSSVTLATENTGDPGPIVYEDVDTAVIAESTATVSIIYEDTDIVVIKYEDTENV